MPKLSKNTINKEIKYSEIISDTHTINIIDADCCDHCEHIEEIFYDSHFCNELNLETKPTKYCKKFRRTNT